MKVFEVKMVDENKASIFVIAHNSCEAIYKAFDLACLKVNMPKSNETFSHWSRHNVEDVNEVSSFKINEERYNVYF